MSHLPFQSFSAMSLLAAVAAAGPAIRAETRVPCNTLPATVLSTAKAEAGDATIRGCVKDREHGKLTYEVETLKKGMSRDIALDASGKILEIEQQVPASSLPAAVADAIAKAAKGGRVDKIESVSRGGSIASYEATIRNNGRSREIAFSPQGAPVQAD